MKKLLLSISAICIQLSGQRAAPCAAANPPASLTAKFSNYTGELNTDPRSSMWRKAQSTTIVKDCSRILDYPKIG